MGAYLWEMYGNFFIQSDEWLQSDNTEEIKWQSVQNAEPKCQSPRKPGRWRAVQINLENVCN